MIFIHIFCLRGKVSFKAAHNWAEKFSQGSSVGKWLRQQSEDLHATGFDAWVKRWDKCINDGAGYVEKKKCFLSTFEYHIFYVLIHL
jgi:hypothetical protein